MLTTFDICVNEAMVRIEQVVFRLILKFTERWHALFCPWAMYSKRICTHNHTAEHQRGRQGTKKRVNGVVILIDLNPAAIQLLVHLGNEDTVVEEGVQLLNGEELRTAYVISAPT